MSGLIDNDHYDLEIVHKSGHTDTLNKVESHYCADLIKSLIDDIEDTYIHIEHNAGYYIINISVIASINIMSRR